MNKLHEFHIKYSIEQQSVGDAQYDRSKSPKIDACLEIEWQEILDARTRRNIALINISVTRKLKTRSLLKYSLETDD